MRARHGARRVMAAATSAQIAPAEKPTSRARPVSTAQSHGAQPPPRREPGGGAPAGPAPPAPAGGAEDREDRGAAEDADELPRARRDPRPAGPGAPPRDPRHEHIAAEDGQVLPRYPG